MVRIRQSVTTTWTVGCFMFVVLVMLFARNRSCSKRKHRVGGGAGDDTSYSTDTSPMRYSIKIGSESLQAQEFLNVPNRTLLSASGLSSVKPLTKDTFYDFVFVVATSSAANGAFFDVMDAIAKVQKHFPNHKIFFYDLTKTPASDRVAKIMQLCKVVYRKFNFDLYPAHVADLGTYAYRPLVINDLLRDQKTIFWIEGDNQLKSSNFDQVRQQMLSGKTNLMLFDGAGHSIFAATHPDMYKYLPMSTESAVLVDMRGFPIYIHCTQELYEGVIRWWVLCALEPKCIAPTKDVNCKFEGNDRRRKYANCHRFERSALNILAANYHHFIAPIYHAEAYDVGMKRTQNKEDIRVCHANRTVGTLKSQSYF